jgi:hypothetical protein
MVARHLSNVSAVPGGGDRRHQRMNWAGALLGPFNTTEERLMRRNIGIVAIAGLLGALAGAAPAAAFPGQTSCAPLAHEFVVPLAHSGELGTTASALARQGALAEAVATQHAALCDPG